MPRRSTKALSIPGSGELDDVGGGILFRQTKTDFSPGTVKHTKNPANLAILGDGFFTVKKGDETFLTRAGNFEINSRGELVTPQGYAVLDESGAPVVMNLDNKEWNISDTGALRQRGRTQNLAIVKPAANEQPGQARRKSVPIDDPDRAGSTGPSGALPPDFSRCRP